ncbi:hypothetical protein BH23CHL6_BH23CHL6_11730 [soil metagenome]
MIQAEAPLDASPTHRRRWPALATRPAVSGMAIATLLLALAMPVLAADEPAHPGLTMEARALMGGNVRPGAWAAINVQVTNDGPSLTGELRVRSPQAGRSVYGLPVELPGTSRQLYTLYAQPPLFGTLVHVDLVSGGRTVLTQQVPVKTHDAYAPIIAVVAERPEGLLGGVGTAAREMIGRGFEVRPASVITITIADLPPRVQAWSAIDRLIWQDVDARQLSAEQLEALRLWLSAGGRLIVLGGTTGIGTVSGFPADLLPFTPAGTVDVGAADLGGMLGAPPAGVTSAPALAGTLRDGTVWARSGEHVIAAQSDVGQGTVTLVGINPAEAWLSDSDGGRSLWRRLLPAGTGAQVNVLNLADDSVFVGVLNSLPSIDLPPIEQLFLLLFAYVALIGPVNYLVLRRLDRREWAWVTMPALVAIFAVGSYGMGASLKGSDVIVNEVAIVRAGEGTDRGLGQVYVGIFSPSRRTFDVRVLERALLTTPATEMQSGQPSQPLDILIGETARVRNFEVGFGLLRAFRAESATPAPLIEADLRLTRGSVAGTVTNRSDAVLEHAAVAYAGGVAVLGSLEPGESAEVDIDTAVFSGVQLSERIFGATFPTDEAGARTAYTRRAVIDQISNYSAGIAGTNGGPMLIGWRPGAVLDIELVGEEPNRVGDSLYLVLLSMALDQEAVFHDQMMVKTVIENTAGEGFIEGNSYYLGRGAMVVEMRPGTFNGRLAVQSLELSMTQSEVLSMRGTGTPISPLPAAEQPDQDDPVGPPDGAGGGGGGVIEPRMDMPNMQLLDHTTGLWVEFPRFSNGRAYLIEQPGRYVDDGGRVLARLVNRAGVAEQNYFSLLVRLAGTVE